MNIMSIYKLSYHFNIWRCIQARKREKNHETKFTILMQHCIQARKREKNHETKFTILMQHCIQARKREKNHETKFTILMQHCIQARKREKNRETKFTILMQHCIQARKREKNHETKFTILMQHCIQARKREKNRETKRRSRERRRLYMQMLQSAYQELQAELLARQVWSRTIVIAVEVMLFTLAIRGINDWIVLTIKMWPFVLIMFKKIIIHDHNLMQLTEVQAPW